MTNYLETEFCGINFKNPVSTCSGTYGFGIEYGRFLPVETLGSITTKGLTFEPRHGNPGVRIIETPSGMLNAIGLENPGAEIFKKTILPQMQERLGDCKIIANISGSTLDDYARISAYLDDAKGIAMYEVNISCPNVSNGGMAFGVTSEGAASVCRAVKENTSKPVMVKLSPNVTDVVSIAKSVAKAGADALALINTLLGLSIDINKKRPTLGNITGGLSGAAIRPVGVRAVWQVAQVVDIPILGMGGISCWQDAMEYILAGADMVAVGAGSFANPALPFDVLEGLETYCQDQGVKNICELVGEAWR